MIALIPGLSSALASLQPRTSASPAPQEGFSQVLEATAQSASGGESKTPPAPPRYEVQPGESLTAIARKLGYDNPNALAQANQLKDPDRLQIGQVLTLPANTPAASQTAPTRLAAATVKLAPSRPQAAAAASSVKGRGQLVSASWYGSQHHGKLMANGQPFNMYGDTVAHKSLPLGTRLTIVNPQNGNAVKVQVTDRGPYISGRSLDLSYGAARKLGVVNSGVSRVLMEGG